MRELYWIDDDFVQMKHIAQGVISKLWELNQLESEGVHSKIIVFGNAYMEDERRWEWGKLSSQQEEDKSYQELLDLYTECCFKFDRSNPERKVFHAKRELCRDIVLYLLKINQCEDQEMFDDIRKTWEKPGDSIKNEEVELTAINQVTKLIERMNIPQGAVVGIDLSLLHGDIERIRNEQRVISMELYRQLRISQYKCFLYSAQASEIDFSEKWKQTFAKCYPEMEIENDQLIDIKVYERKEFLSKGSEEIVSKLRNLLDNG